MALEVISEIIRDMESGQRIRVVRRANSSATGNTSSASERQSEVYFDLFLRNVKKEEPTYFFLLRRARMQRYEYFRLMREAKLRFQAHYSAMLAWRLYAYRRYKDMADANTARYREWKRAAHKNLMQYRAEQRKAEAKVNVHRNELKADAKRWLKQVAADKLAVKKEKELTTLYASRKPFAKQWNPYAKVKYSSKWLTHANSKYAKKWIEPRLERKRIDRERQEEEHATQIKKESAPVNR